MYFKGYDVLFHTWIQPLIDTIMTFVFIYMKAQNYHDM